MIRALVSDFGGVLTTPLSAAFFAYGERTGISPERFRAAMQAATEAGGGLNPLYELEVGAISEDEFLRRIEVALGGGATLEGFAQAFFDRLQPNEEMIALMRELKAGGLRMALLTNNVREWEPLWRPKLPDIDAIFEIVVDSAFVGMRKPDPEIYRLTIARLDEGLRPEECLMVDDLEVNCAGARAVGMRAVRYEEPAQAVAEIRAAVAAGDP